MTSVQTSHSVSDNNDKRSSFDLEPNPFEQSFAKDGSPHQPHSTHLEQVPSSGEERRQPLPSLSVLSPGIGNSTPATPGSLWNYGMHPHAPQLGHRKKSSLSDSLLRTGLTPGGGGLNHLHQAATSNPFAQIPGLSTPSILQGGALTPGLSSLLGMANTGTHGVQHHDVVSNADPHQSQSQVPSHQMQVPPHQVQVPPHQISQVPSHQVQVPSHQAPQVQIPQAPLSQVPQTHQAPLSQPPQPVHHMPHMPHQPHLQPPSHFEPQQGLSAKRQLSDSDPPSSKKSKTLRNSASQESPQASSPEDEKRKHFLERNRVAASKCRKRKKELMGRMQEELTFYSSSFDSLNQQVSSLREQVITLRSILFSHKECSGLVESMGGYDALASILNATNIPRQIPPQSGFPVPSAMHSQASSQVQSPLVMAPPNPQMHTISTNPGMQVMENNHIKRE